MTAYVELSLPQRTLKKLIKRTKHAMVQQDVRYHLNGLLLDALGALDGNLVKMSFDDTSSSCLLQNPNDDGCHCVIMSMHL